MNEFIWSPREFVIHTASVISFVLYGDKSQSKTLKYDLGISVSRITISGFLCTGNACIHPWLNGLLYSRTDYAGISSFVPDHGGSGRLSAPVYDYTEKRHGE